MLVSQSVSVNSLETVYCQMLNQVLTVSWRMLSKSVHFLDFQLSQSSVSAISEIHQTQPILKLDVSTSIRGLHQKLVLSSSGSWHNGSVGSCRHHGSWPVILSFGCVWPLIHLVKCSGSLSITVAWDQLMTWYSWVAWSVRAHLLCSVKVDARRLLVNVRRVLDSCVPVIWLQISFLFCWCRSCHSWHKQLCTHILLSLPSAVHLLMYHYTL